MIPAIPRGHKCCTSRKARCDSRDREGIGPGVVSQLQIGKARSRWQSKHNLFIKSLADNNPIGPGVVIRISADIGSGAGKAPLVEIGCA